MNSKMSIDEIENKPGVLGAKIVLGALKKNNKKLWFVGNLYGTSLLTVGINNSYGIVAFTEYELAYGFINRNKKLLLNGFGEHVICANLSLLYLQSMLNPENMMMMNNIIINPVLPTYFVPLKLSVIKNILPNNMENIEFDAEDEEKLIHLIFNKETHSFEEKNEYEL